MVLAHRDFAETGHNFSSEQLNGTHYLLMGKTRETECAENVVYPSLLSLLETLDDNLRGSAQRRETGMTGVVPSISIFLAITPGFIARGYVAVLVHRHPYCGPVAGD